MRTTQRLPVQLTDEELLDRSTALVDNIQKTAALEEEKKSVDADFKGKIKARAEVSRKLTEIISNRTEDREVECEVKKDFERGTVTTVRMDTGEVVETRPITADERQEELRFSARKERAPAKGRGGKPFGMDDASTPEAEG